MTQNVEKCRKTADNVGCAKSVGKFGMCKMPQNVEKVTKTADNVGCAKNVEKCWKMLDVQKTPQNVEKC